MFRVSFPVFFSFSLAFFLFDFICERETSLLVFWGTISWGGVFDVQSLFCAFFLFLSLSRHTISFFHFARIAKVHVRENFSV